MSNVVDRAKAALEDRCTNCGTETCGWQEMQFAEDCRGTEDEPGLVPELIAAVEWLQSEVYRLKYDNRS